MQKNEYDINIIKVIDGDTVDVDIDLGFNICLRNERVRIIGIDAPESRTSDPLEKLFGLAAKKKVYELLIGGGKLITTENTKGEDMRGKYGRILGDFRTSNGRMLTEILISEGYCVPYHGGSKDDIKDLHLINRERLLDEGIVSKEVYNDTKENL
jgi:micrococcal nuclease